MEAAEFKKLTEQIDEFTDERFDEANRLRRDIEDLELAVHVERVLDRIETLRMRENVDDLPALADYDALALVGGYFLGHTNNPPSVLFGKDAPEDELARTYTDLAKDLTALRDAGEHEAAKELTTSITAVMTSEMIWTSAVWWALAGNPKMVKSTFNLFASPKAFRKNVKKHVLKVCRYFGDNTAVGIGGEQNPAIGAMQRVVDLYAARNELADAFGVPYPKPPQRPSRMLKEIPDETQAENGETP